MYSYTIMPLNVDHVAELCEDIEKQIRGGTADCALFSMSLAPEGNPPIDKAAILCEQFDLFRDILNRKGIPCGILVQATIGHGYYQNKEFPYTRYTQLTDGQQTNTCCPYDKGFQDYIRTALRTVAIHHPCTIMVDDDFRLMAYRAGKACACSHHMEQIRKRTGIDYTRESLYEKVFQSDKEALALRQVLIDTQRDAVLQAAKAMREGIDSVDPSLPGTFCACGNSVEFADEIAGILAGQGNPKVVRIHNGNYCTVGSRGLSNVSHRAAAQIAFLKDKVDVILAETDTCPQNRYSTGAYSLHSHYVLSILEGAAGAKHWITRMEEYEPISGKAYRAVLAKYKGFYEHLMKLTPTLSWKGCRIPLRKNPDYGFGTQMGEGWFSCVLERLGLPLYFSEQNGGVVFLDEFDPTAFADQEIKSFFAGGVVLSAVAAAKLNEMGYGAYTGVHVREWIGEKPEFERLFGGSKRVSLQKACKELQAVDASVRADSWVYSCVDGKHEKALFPGTTLYQNPAGGKTVVFSGTPNTRFVHNEAFSFLNESRKRQLAGLLQEIGSIPAWFVGDEEVYFRVAELPDKALICAIFNMGTDPAEEIVLATEKMVHQIERLLPDGSWENCDFCSKDGNLFVKTAMYTLDPVILLLKQNDGRL